MDNQEQLTLRDKMALCSGAVSSNTNYLVAFRRLANHRRQVAAGTFSADVSAIHTNKTNDNQTGNCQ